MINKGKKCRNQEQPLSFLKGHGGDGALPGNLVCQTFSKAGLR